MREEVLRGQLVLLVTDATLRRGVVLKDGGACESEHLGQWKELLDGLVGVPELRAMAFIEDKHDALAAQLLEPLGVVYAARGIECDTQLLNSRNDDLVGVVFRKHSFDECTGCDVLFHAVRLETVELITFLGIQILAVDDEEHFLDGLIPLQQRGCLEAGQRLAAARGVPHVPVAAILIDATDDVADSINLVRPHHQDLLFGLNEDHVAADHLTEDALRQELLCEVVQVCDLRVVLLRPFVDRQESLFCIEGEVAIIIIAEVICVGLVADDEDLQKAQQGIRVAVAGIRFIGHDLLQRLTRIDRKLLQFDLNHGYPVKEQNNVVAVKAVGRVHAQLVDHFKGVLAPVASVNQLEMEGRAVFALEGVSFAKTARCVEDILPNDLLEEPIELFICQLATIERLKLLTKIGVQRGTVADVAAISVFQIFELADEMLLENRLRDGRGHRLRSLLFAWRSSTALR